MPSRSAEATATSARRSITSGWLTESAAIRWPESVVIAVGPEIVIIITVADLIAIAVPGARGIVGSSSPGPVCPLIAVAGGTGDQTIAVAGAVESPQTRINRIRTISAVFTTAGHNHTSAIVRIIEIRVVPAIPHVVTIPAHIWISEAQTKRRSESKTQAITIRRIAISISKTSAQAGGIIRVSGTVVIKIGPAGRILHLHPDVLIAGRRAVVISLLRFAGIIFILVTAAGCSSLGGGSRRIVYVIGCLRRLTGGRAAAQYDQRSSQ